MSVSVVAAIAAAVAIYWYFNRHKPLLHILSDFKHMIDMQGAGAAGLIDDWVNLKRNKIVLPAANGKVAVVTGGGRGIGTEVIKGLLKANMKVVMGIRNPDIATNLAKTMENGDNLTAFKLDLKSLKSVKEFAEKVTELHPKVHILVNNAGVMFGDYEVTEDGFESQLAVNHLGHFYLTHLLLPVLKKAGTEDGPSRIVNVTSCAHYPGKIYFNDINMKQYYDTTAAYSQAKLCQLMSARHINRIMEENNYPVKAFAVHPGIVDTDLFNGTLFKTVFPWAMKMFFKTPAKGAVSILFACFEKSLDKKGGLYISNCVEGISSKLSKNLDHQQKLYDISCELVKIDKNSYGR